MNSVFIFVIVVTSVSSSDAFFSWLFGWEHKNRNEGATHESEKGGLLTSKPVPFDMKTTDESFLASAQLSALDKCHHNTVATIQGTCSSLSEEDMGKLAVQLLNCQLAAEGRPIFQCTNVMTIAECTASMDPTSWNAYQIVTNRALAVCYATRQQQFRLKTEYTVNQLVHSTQQQLQAMDELQDGQKKVSEAATDMLDKVASGQQQLMSRQEALRAQQLDVHSRLSGNIRELVKEKSLIAAGNRELATLTESMKKKIDNATFQLSEQGQIQKKNHHQILGDLLEIRNRAAEVWQKIDNSSRRVLDIQLETQRQYEQTMKNLEQVNATVTYIVTAIHDMESLVESKINSVAGLIGGTGESMALVSTVALHVLYFLVAAVAAAFLHTPAFSRLILFLLVPLNAWVAIHRGESLGFASMTMFILLTVAANWLISWLIYVFNFRTPRLLALGVGPASPASNRSTSSSADSGPPSPSNGPQTPGANGPDIQRLLTVLDDLYKSGALTPAAVMSRCGSPVPPLSAQQSRTRVSDVTLNVATPTYPPPTPLSQQDASFGNLPKEDDARRHLLRYLDTSLRYSPTPSRTSTPSKRSTGRGSMSRESVMSNQSTARPLCLATTKLGNACRNSSVSGSAFCQRHQV